jgi:5-methylcytosine-specific restriction endonuclease McrA
MIMIRYTRKTTLKRATGSLKAKLDRIFSEYIRLRDADTNGYCRCISCGSIHHWKEMDAGHFVNRSHMSTRYDERNVNAQCRKCNRFDEGNPIGYARGLIKKYGKGIIDELEVKKHSVSRTTESEYRLLVNHYKVEVMELKKVKGG